MLACLKGRVKGCLLARRRRQRSCQSRPASVVFLMPVQLHEHGIGRSMMPQSTLSKVQLQSLGTRPMLAQCLPWSRGSGAQVAVSAGLTQVPYIIDTLEAERIAVIPAQFNAFTLRIAS